MRRCTTLLLSSALLASCQTGQPVAQTGAVDTHEAMVSGINPAALAIWDVSNKAMGEAGGLDPALMDAAAWSQLEQGARLLEQHSLRLAEADVLRVGAHDDELPGFATRAEIQAMIDVDPEGFRDLSRDMAQHARDLREAAIARNLQLSGDLADSLSEPCQACHTRYWEKPVP